jgi:hypothetical protein
MFPWKVGFGDVLYLQIGDFSAKMIPNPNPWLITVPNQAPAVLQKVF